jgi:hypothetical protein
MPTNKKIKTQTEKIKTHTKKISTQNKEDISSQAKTRRIKAQNKKRKKQRKKTSLQNKKIRTLQKKISHHRPRQVRREKVPPIRAPTPTTPFSLFPQFPKKVWPIKSFLILFFIPLHS